MTQQRIRTTVQQTRLRTAVDNAETTVTATVAAVEPAATGAGDRVTQIAYIGKQGVPGPQGDPGPQGNPGPPGPAGGTYTHTQGTAAAVWSITHNLGFFPNVTVLDSAGTEVEGDVAYVDANNLTVTFTAAFGGVAYLS